jgi:hypothetical protein
MQRIQELIAIIKKLIKEDDDKVLNIRGGKGYSVGHPYPAKERAPVNRDLGDPGPYEPEEETEDESPVKISKAFKKE